MPEVDVRQDRELEWITGEAEEGKDDHGIGKKMRFRGEGNERT